MIRIAVADRHIDEALHRARKRPGDDLKERFHTFSNPIALALVEALRDDYIVVTMRNIHTKAYGVLALPCDAMAWLRSYYCGIRVEPFCFDLAVAA